MAVLWQENPSARPTKIWQNFSLRKCRGKRTKQVKVFVLKTAVCQLARNLVSTLVLQKCYSTVTCKVFLNQPQHKIGQHDKVLYDHPM